MNPLDQIKAAGFNARVMNIDSLISRVNEQFPGRLPPEVLDEWENTKANVRNRLASRFQPVEGGESDSIGQPWRQGMQNVAKMAFKSPAMGMQQLATGAASLPIPSAALTMPGYVPPQQDVELARKGAAQTYEALDPLRKQFFEAVDVGMEEMIPAKKPTGKYAAPPKNLKEYFTDPKRAWMTLGQNGPQLVYFAGATLANPIFGTLVMAGAEGTDTQESIDSFEKATGKKIPTEYKMLLPSFVGAANAALEKFGLDQIIKVSKIPGLKGKIIQGILATISEGSQEGLQEVNQILAELGYNPNALDWKRIAEAVYGGALLGFGGSVISGTTGTVKEYYEGVKKNDQPPPVTPPPGESQGQPPPGGPPPGTGPQPGQPPPGGQAGPGQPPPGAGPQAQTGQQAPPKQEPGYEGEPEPIPPEDVPKYDTKGRFKEIPHEKGWSVYVNVKPDGKVDFFAHNPDVPEGPIDRVIQLEDGSKKLIEGAFRSNARAVSMITGLPISHERTLRTLAKKKEAEDAARLRGDERPLLPGVQKEIQLGPGIETGKAEGRPDLEQPKSGKPGRKGKGLKLSEGARTYAQLVRSMGGLRATDDIRGEFKESIPLFIKNKKGYPLDIMAQMLQERGLPVKDARDLLDKIRSGALVEADLEEVDTEKQRETSQAAEIEDFEKFQPKDIPAGLLDKGDKFNIRGEEYHVEEIKPGKIRIKDGEEMVLDEFDTVPIDKGEVKAGEKKAEQKGGFSRIELQKRHEELKVKAETAGDEEITDMLRRVWRVHANLPESDIQSYKNWKSSLDNLEKKLLEKFPLAGPPNKAGEEAAEPGQPGLSSLLGQAQMPKEKIKRKAGASLQERIESAKKNLNEQIRERNQAKALIEGGYFEKHPKMLQTQNDRMKHAEKEIKRIQIEISNLESQTSMFEKAPEKEQGLFEGTDTGVVSDQIAEYLADKGVVGETANKYAKQIKAGLEAIENADKTPYPTTETTERILKGKATKEEVEEAFSKTNLISAIVPGIIKKEVDVSALVGKQVHTPADFAALVLPLRNPFFESMKVAYLDDDMNIIGAYVHSIGTVNASLFDPAEITANAPKNTAGIIFSHNHPSGNTVPSAEDRACMEGAREATNAAGFALIDHIITDGDSYYSFSEQAERKVKKYYSHPAEVVPPKKTLKIAGPQDFQILSDILRQNPDNIHIVYLSSANTVLAVERIVGGGRRDIERSIAKTARGIGTAGILIDWPNAKRIDPEVRLLLETTKKLNVPLLDISSNAAYSYAQEGIIGETKPSYGKTSAVREEDTGGYAPEIGKYREGEKSKGIPLPELVKMARTLLGDKYPKILKKLASKAAIGLFRHGFEIGIELKADIFKGHELLTHVSKTKLGEDEKNALISKTGLTSDRVIITQTWNPKTREWVAKVYEIDAGLARKVLAHEIGHLVDYLPEMTMSRGNILGRIASIKHYMKKFLENFYGAPGKALSEEDFDRIKKESRTLAKETAEVEVDEEIRTETPVSPEDILKIWNDTTGNIRNTDPGLYNFITGLSTAEKKSIVKEALKGKVPDWMKFKRVMVETRKVKKLVELKGEEYEKRVKEIYKKLIQEEAKKRMLFERDQIMRELKDLTQKWKPFDPEADPQYTKYRFSSKELYADALSVMMNDPELFTKMAPTFERAFKNWFSQKPGVKAVYDGIQRFLARSEEEIFEARHKDIQGMWKRSGEKRIEKERKQQARTKGNLWDDFKKKFADKDQALLRRVRQVEKTKGLEAEKNPRYAKEELDYIHSAQAQYMRDIDQYVVKFGKENGIDEGVIGEYLMLRRAGTERKYLANPLGYDEAESKRQARMLVEKYGDALKIASARFDKIRQRHVIAMLKASGMLSDELMGYIEEKNGNYVTFSVTKYLEDVHGDNALTASIKRQIGTFQEIENPLFATVVKDIIMVRAAQRKISLVNVVDFMQKHFPEEVRPAEKKWDANTNRHKPVETKEAGWKTLLYMDKGKIVGVDLPEDLAEIFETDFKGTSALTRFIGKIQAPWKDLVVGKNLAWMVWNIQRDFRGTYIKNPEVSFWKLAANMVKSARDAALDVFKDKSTPIVREMYEQNALIQGRHYTSAVDNPTEMMDRLMAKWGLRESEYKSKVLKPFQMLLNTLEKMGKFSERITKIAGYKTLKEAGVEQKEIAHRLRGRVGSPDFYRRGEWFSFYNNLFTFSNAGTQGLRSFVEAARQSPGSVARRMVFLELAPKLMMRLVQAGALVALAKALSGGDDDDELVKLAKKYQGIMEKIPERDKANYMCIPLGETDSGKAVYMVMPHDFTGQTLSALFWKLTGGEDFNVEDLVDYVNGGLPYSSLNPYLQLMIDTIQYGRGKNPYDTWSGRTMIPETKFEAGGLERAKAFSEQEWNRIGLSYLYKFKYDDLDKVQGEYEKLLDAPSVGPALKRFVRVSDRGISDKSRKLIEKDEKEKARKRIRIEKEIVKGLNETERPGEIHARQLYRKLRESTDVGEWSDFWKKYQTRMNYRENTSLNYDLQKARSNKQKAMILSKYLKVDVGETQIKSALRLNELREKKRTDKLTRDEERTLKMLENLFSGGNHD